MPDAILNLPGETWKPVVGYEGLYEVSNMGRLKSLSKYSGDYLRPTIIMKPKNRAAHRDVTLHRFGQRRGFWVHRLVLEAFVGPCPPGMECCHFPDRNPHNNRLDNLRWGSPADNAEDRRKHGTIPFGEQHKRAVLKVTDVLDIRYRGRLPGANLAALAREFGVAPNTIHHIVKNRNWRWLKDAA